MKIDCWNGVRWKPCREAELPFSMQEGVERGLAFRVAADHWRAWPTIEAKRDWQLFIGQTYMTEPPPRPKVKKKDWSWT